MTNPEPSFSVDVDVTNSGQFFACCGLLEIADRLWPGAEGWFDDGWFHIAQPEASLAGMVNALKNGEFWSDDKDADGKTCPMCLSLAQGTSTSTPGLRLDWWLETDGVGGRLKTWAGQQKVTAMAQAMWCAAIGINAVDAQWFNRATLAYDPDSPRKVKVVEPFYFDARRYAHALDVGFSLDTQNALTQAHPAVEFLTLIGLQRFRPCSINGRAFEYHVWMRSLPILCASAVACGAVPLPFTTRYRFSLQFRDDQKRYKAFGFSQPIGDNT